MEGSTGLLARLDAFWDADRAHKAFCWAPFPGDLAAFFLWDSSPFSARMRGHKRILDTQRLTLENKMEKLFLHQEVCLLALTDDKGTFSDGMYIYALAGAMVSELLLQERISADSSKQQIVRVVKHGSTGDEILDEVLNMIAESKKPRGLQHWVSKVAVMSKLQHRLAQQLCDLGILRHDEKKVLWLFTRQVYPEVDGSYEDAIRLRMANVMFDTKGVADGPTSVLIALASHAGLMKQNFAPVELRQHADRIKQLASGEFLAAGATQTVIQAVQTAIMVAAIIPAVTVATTSSVSS